jgi:ribosomal subunit interface protein
MQIQITFGGIDHSEALTNYIREQVTHGLRHHPEKFTRVEVHLHDDHAGRNGPDDKRCVMEVRPSGFDPLVVEDAGDDWYKVVNAVSKKLERAIHHFVDRHFNQHR